MEQVSSKWFLFFWGLMLCLSEATPTWAKPGCGTAQLMQHLRENQKPTTANSLNRTVSAPQICITEDYYDEVNNRITEHFQIFYTLQGPHQTTEEFIDTLALALEYSWNFHVKGHGFLSPLGDTLTLHYQKKVQEGLYPVEVIDIDLMRGTEQILGRVCHGCYGLTIPNASIPQSSILLIDNDFRYTPVQNATLDTMDNPSRCTYVVATQELQNKAHQYSYADHWEKGIRVTVLHELYHAIQFSYLDMNKYWNFWCEASASGVEEIGYPQIDDYFAYLPNMAKAVGTPLDKMQQDYGAGLLYIYLYKHVNKNTDKFIWESFKRNPADSFQQHLIRFSQKNHLSVDSLFHDFAVKLSFAGSRSPLTDSSTWINDDEPKWPNFSYKASPKNIPTLQSLSYQFYNSGKLNLENAKGRTSLIYYKGNEAEVHSILNTNQGDSLYATSQIDPLVDSIAWVVSFFNDTTTIPTIISDKTLRAYPTPWRQGNLCFTPLPQNKNFIEIRNRRGNLVARENYDKTTLCIEESKVKKLMTPGLYHFRAGNSGKLKDLMVIY